MFIERTDAEAETPLLWPPDAKSWHIWKDPDAGKDWRQEEKGTTEDEMVWGHHRLNGVWVISGNWWWTGRPGVLWSMGSQRVGQDWVAELNLVAYVINFSVKILTRQFQLKYSESESHSVMSDSLRPHGLYSLWNSPGRNTEVGSLALLQEIFPTQGSNPGLLHCRWILYRLSYQRIILSYSDLQVGLRKHHYEQS